NGTTFSGTPGPVTGVIGTLVCNPGDDTQALLDTPEVPLSEQGDAAFSGQIGSIPAACSNPLFLIRIATPAQAPDRRITNGTGVQAVKTSTITTGARVDPIANNRRCDDTALGLDGLARVHSSPFAHASTGRATLEDSSDGSGSEK